MRGLLRHRRLKCYPQGSSQSRRVRQGNAAPEEDKGEDMQNSVLHRLILNLAPMLLLGGGQGTRRCYDTRTRFFRK
jgi:hypothetical protein